MIQNFKIDDRDNSARFRKPTFRPAFRLIGSLGCILFVAACQTVDRNPLEIASHRERWEDRRASSEEVLAFAKRLTERPGTGTTTNSPFNPSDGLSLREAKLIALVFHPDLRVARLKAGVTAAKAEHAGLWKDPTFGIDALKVIEDIPDPWVIGSPLTFTIPVSGRLAAEKMRADAALHAELARVTETEWKVVMDLQKAWLSWSADRTRLLQTQEIIKTLNGIVTVTEELSKQGELPKTEAALFAIERASLRAELARLKGEVEVGEQNIRALMGLTPKAPLNLHPVLDLPDATGGETALVKQNPTLGRLRSEYEVTERALCKEVRKQYPDLSFGPQGQTDRGESALGLVASIPLPFLNANRGGIAVAKARREVARAAFETEYERQVGQLAVLSSRLNSVRLQRASIQKDLIPMIDRQVRDAAKLVELGEGGSLVLLESLVRAHEAKLKIITMQNRDAQLQSDLQALLGPFIPEAR